MINAMKKRKIKMDNNIRKYPIFVMIDFKSAPVHLLVSYTYLIANVRYMTDPAIMIVCMNHDGGKTVRLRIYRNIITSSRKAV